MKASFGKAVITGICSLGLMALTAGAQNTNIVGTLIVTNSVTATNLAAKGSIALGAGAQAGQTGFAWSDGEGIYASNGQFVVYASNGIFLDGSPIVGDGSMLTSLSGANISSNSITGDKLAPNAVGTGQLATEVILNTHIASNASISGSKLMDGSIGFTKAITNEWNTWGDGRYVNVAGDTMSGGLTAANLRVTGRILQDLENGSVGIEAAATPVQRQTNGVWIGKGAMSCTYDGNLNTIIGYYAFNLGTGSYNIAVGPHALGHVNGTHNQAVGTIAGYGSAGNYNSSFGWMSGSYAPGSGNSAYGHSSHESATGSYNTAIGYASLRYATGEHNTAIGLNTLYLGVGSYNTALGGYALTYSPGSCNTALGYAAGKDVTNSQRSVFIGYRAGHGQLGTIAVTNSVVLGAEAQVTANDTVVLGSPTHTVVFGGTSSNTAKVVISPAGDLIVSGKTTLACVVAQGDILMGSYTNGLPQ